MLVHYLLVTFINSTGADYNLEVDLCHSIVPALSKTRVMTTKIEIRMKKKMGVQWKALEGVGTDGTEGMCRVSSQSHSLFANYFIGVSKTDVWWKPPSGCNTCFPRSISRAHRLFIPRSIGCYGESRR